MDRKMQDFLNKVVKGDGVMPPEPCIRAIENHFHGAINVEWSERGKNYEAVFYLDNLEYVACFDVSGALVEERQRIDLLSPEVVGQLKGKGEIMNQVLITRSGERFYEVIVRDKLLNRFVIELRENGNTITEKRL